MSTTTLSILCGCGHPAWQHDADKGGRCGNYADLNRCTCTVPRAEVIERGTP